MTSDERLKAIEQICRNVFDESMKIIHGYTNQCYNGEISADEMGCYSAPYWGKVSAIRGVLDILEVS